MQKKPNIVFILTDDQGYGDLGCTGNTIIKTPHIDQVHDDAIRLTNFHVGPTCAPTRAGLMTGHYANSTGVWHTIGGRSLLRKDEWTLASALKENGYTTGIFGKWHLGDSYPYRPQDRGFDISIVHGGGGISQTPDWWGNDYFDDTYMTNGEPKKYSGYCTDVFFDEAINFIEDNKDRQFFCYIPTNAPHFPYNVDNKYTNMYKDLLPDNINRARFFGMISNIDENVGILRKRLKDLKLEENTILIFMTDNGTSGGVITDNSGFVIDGYGAGLRGKKNSEYDGGHRVPFFIHWPMGKLNGGKDINDLVANIDFMPTILDLCNISINDNHHFHGKSIVPLLYENEDKTLRSRVIVTDSQRVPYPIKWKNSSVMTNRWRLINGQELYDIQVDREQKNDIAFQHQEIVDRLRMEYDKWWNVVSEKFNEEIPIVIGDRPITMTCHDIRNEDCIVPYNQRLIRYGNYVTGYWEIEIEVEGSYQFELRRWPNSTSHAISKGIEGSDIEFNKAHISEDLWDYYKGGSAIPINNANIKVQDQKYSCSVTEEDTGVNFIVPLKKGKSTLEAWFSKGEHYITSAYYIDVSKV